MASTTTNHRTDDLELLNRVLGGKSQAWSEFVNRYRGLVFRCAGKVLSRHHTDLTNSDIEEVCANVWFQLWRKDMKKLRAWDPDRGSRLSSWIGMISVNCAYDFLRDLGRRPRCEEIDTASVAFSYRTDPLATITQAENARFLKLLLGSCSERERQFVELYFARGCEPEEIAEVMSISVKTVYSKKTKIRDKLVALAAKRGADYALAA